MLSDDDGEYFCRVLLNSDGTRFVPDARMYYRAFRYDGLAYVGNSDEKRIALWRSQLHMKYLLSLENDSRSRAACVTYIQRNLINFYPDKADILKEAEQVATDLSMRLTIPSLSWKYSWIRALGLEDCQVCVAQEPQDQVGTGEAAGSRLFRIENRDARLGLPEAQVGIPSQGSSQVKSI